MVDVIVPVFRGLEETRRCLESVLSGANAASAEIVAVDDCTPDAAIAGLLDGLAQAGRITLLRNPSNVGFVESVNRGMQLHPDRDVVLLNSDTEVANDWLVRLRDAAYCRERIATVTPFSNNATICSYPYNGWEGGVPGGLGLAALDRLFAQANHGRTLELPTAVGFCMYIRRDALREVGLFDAQRYGHGYGEENDFSLSARKAGWRNLLACDVFVFHAGAVSFSSERERRVEAATQALLQVHPEYNALVHDFVVADPAEPLRRGIDRARVALDPAEVPHVLAERAAERDALLLRLHAADRHAAERGAHAMEVHEALDRVSELARDRLRQIEEAEAARQRMLAELGAEIDNLRTSLARAEAAAASHQEELQRIRAHWLGRAYRLLMRMQRPGQPAKDRAG